MTLTTEPALPEPRTLLDHLPAASHNRQLANCDIQETVLSILAP